MKDYVVVDIENPNFRQNSICAIGIIIVRDNKVIKKLYSLINPEDTFDRINIDITKITPHMVKDKPTFKEYWNKIEDILTKNIIVGHNVTYDLRVISKSLLRYEMPVPDFKYCCTLTLSRRNLNLPSYKLENIAKNLHIIYNPHNAIEDARASQEVFEYINRKKTITLKEVKPYKYVPKVVEKYNPKLSTNINNLYGIIRVLLFREGISEAQFALLVQWHENNKVNNQYLVFHRINLELKGIIERGYLTGADKKSLANIVDYVPISCIYNNKTLKVQVLHGIIQAITADDQVTLEELTHLKRWLKRNKLLTGSYPYDKILQITEKHLENNFMTFNEEKEVSNIFKELINPIKNTDGTLHLKNKTFCLTGDFVHGNREEITSQLENIGLIPKKSVSGKVDYLFVGDLGSSAWKYGNIGSKIVKAQKIQEKGGKIKIITEKNLFEQLINKNS